LINAVIPARFGSQRVHNKNLRLLGNHPLLAYSIEACKQALNIDRVIVSTDSQEIADIALSYGAEVPFLRPEKFARNDSSDHGFLNHFFDNIDCHEVALIRPTTPLRDPAFIDEIVTDFHEEDAGWTGLRTMAFSNHSPYKMFMIDAGLCCGFFSDFKGVKDYSNLPGQAFPKTYIPNGYIDIVKKTTVKSGSSFGDWIHAKISPEILDIDTEFDFRMVELQIQTEFDRLSHALDERTKND